MKWLELVSRYTAKNYNLQPKVAQNIQYLDQLVSEKITKCADACSKKYNIEVNDVIDAAYLQDEIIGIKFYQSMVVFTPLTKKYSFNLFVNRISEGLGFDLNMYAEHCGKIGVYSTDYMLGEFGKFRSDDRSIILEMKNPDKKKSGKKPETIYVTYASPNVLKDYAKENGKYQDKNIFIATMLINWLNNLIVFFESSKFDGTSFQDLTRYGILFSYYRLKKLLLGDSSINKSIFEKRDLERIGDDDILRNTFIEYYFETITKEDFMRIYNSHVSVEQEKVSTDINISLLDAKLANKFNQKGQKIEISRIIINNFKNKEHVRLHKMKYNVLLGMPIKQGDASNL
jgi:hypothetical protein